MVKTIGIDGHVLTGRYQGIRTTIISLLRAVAGQLGTRQMIVYSNDPKTADNLLAVPQIEHRGLHHHGSVKRLLKDFPKLFHRDKVNVGVFQYITPLTGNNIVFIHDILPITHGNLFPAKMRIRTTLLFSLSIWRASRVIAVSEYTASEVKRIFPSARAKVRVARNGPSFPIDRYFDTNQPGEKRYILAVGRIEKRKNIHLLIEAFIAAKLDDVELIVVGSFDLGFSYTIPSGSRVRNLTNVSDDELVSLYRGADLFVYPSAAEGFGVPLLDAILFGVPTISSDRTAMPEVGMNLVEYFDPTATNAATRLTDMIRGHFRDRPIRAPSLSARKDHAALFSWERAAKDFLHVVDEVA